MTSYSSEPLKILSSRGAELSADVKRSSPKKAVKFADKLFVGALAGISGTSVIYPLDLMKTRLQSKAAMGTGQSLISSTVSVFRDILSANGVRGFYRGFSTCLVGIAPEKAIKLAVNDGARDYFTSRQSSLQRANGIALHEEIVAGSLAGLLQLIVTVPYEMVKIRLQMQGSLPPELRKSTAQILQEVFPFKMYTGLTATVFRDVPFCFMFFPLYSNIKSALHNTTATTKGEPFHVSLVAGMIAGAISGALVTPADMLKTRIQQNLAGNLSFFEYGKEVVKKEGINALFRGWHTRILVIAPNYGLISLAFELQKRWLLGE